MSDQHWSQMMLPRERIEQLENVNRDLRQQLAKSEARVAKLESREEAMCDLHYANGAKQGYSWGQVGNEAGLAQCVELRIPAAVAERAGGEQ